MKRIMTLLVAGALTASTLAPAFAGGNTTPIVEVQPVYVVEEESNSSAGMLPFILGGGIVLIGLALASNNH